MCLTLTRVIVRISFMKNRALQQRVYGGVKADLRETERRKKLLTAGLEAFGTRGYAKTNIKTICVLAGLTERYFYESFRNKEDLLSAVYQELVDKQKSDTLKILDEAGNRPLDAASSAIRMFLYGFQENPLKAQTQLFEVMGVSPGIDRQYREAMRVLAEMVKLFLMKAFPGISDDAFRGNIIPTGLAGSIVLISHEWVLGGFVTPLDDIIDTCMDLFIAVGRHIESKPRPGSAQKHRPVHRKLQHNQKR